MAKQERVPEDGTRRDASARRLYKAAIRKLRLPLETNG